MDSRRVVVDPVTQVELLVPEGISSWRAIERARKARDGELRSIRLFVDWGHAYPLWESGTDKYGMEPDDYGLSAELAARLLAWTDTFFDHLVPESGWDTLEREQVWHAEGETLADLLELEVYDIAEVQREFRPAGWSAA